MSTCANVAQCVKCKSKDPSKCLVCNGNHTLDASSNSCKCQSNPACGVQEICIQETGECIASNACMKSPFCLQCSYIDPTLCTTCVKDYGLDSQFQCQSLTCKVENCIQCDMKDQRKCSKCGGGLNLSSKNICECESGSNKQCDEGKTCNYLNVCQDIDECFKSPNCLECDPTLPKYCEVCKDRYVYDDETENCQQQSSCADNLCQACNSAIKTHCYSCQQNYLVSLTTGICECVLGSNEGCPEGNSCSKQKRICIPDNKCRVDIMNCDKCWAHDQELCGQCQLGYILSNDRTKCIKTDECMKIKGCLTCNTVVPYLCSECEDGSPNTGDSCGYNQISTGGIVGIVIVIVVVIGVLVGGVFLVKRLKSKTTIKSVDRPRKDFI